MEKGRYFKNTCIDGLCEAKSLKFLDVSIKFDEKTLLKILQNNPYIEEIRSVDNCALTKYYNLVFAEVVCRNKFDLKEAIKYVKSKYKFFTIVPKVQLLIGCEVEGADGSLQMPVLKKKRDFDLGKHSIFFEKKL